jgi:putative hydrolase of the HAD superfamily
MDCYHTQMHASPVLNWSAIDTVLLDMDGTLLDLRFDNWFWLELIPRRYAALHAMPLAEAQAELASRFRDVAGTLPWYCIEHWTRELGLDIGAIKREELARIGYLPGAREFLLRLKASGKRSVLVTNSHPEILAIKNQQVALTQYFDACHSSHPFSYPKEHAAFWPLLEAQVRFEPERTLFVDDSLSVLKAARDYGIGWLRAVRHPDSGRGAQSTGDFVGIDRVSDLM